METCTDFAGGPLLGSLQQKLQVQLEGINLANNELSSVERMIKELMQKREDMLYQIEDRKAEVDATKEQINECKRLSTGRLNQLKKRHCFGDSFSLFDLLPSELYIHIFKYLTPRELCKAAMPTSHCFNTMSQADSIWCQAFKFAWGPVDDRSCTTCRYLAPPLAPTSSSYLLSPSSKTQLRDVVKKIKEQDGDAMMGDLMAGMEKLSMSWLSGYKHRRELENNWKNAKYSVSTLHGHTDWVTCLLSIDDLLISGSWDSSIKMWNLNTKECVVSLSGHTAGINAIDLKGDVLLSASLDCTLRVWNMTTKACTGVLEGHTDQVSHVNFFTPRPTPQAPQQPARMLAVSGSLDGTLRVWDVAALKCLHVLEGHTTGITSVTSSHQYAATGSVDGTIIVWDCLTGRKIFTLTGHTDRVTGLQLDFASSRLASCSWDFEARVWDLKTGTCAHVLKGHVFRIRCLTLHDNVLVTGSWDSDLKVWDLTTGTCIKTLSGHSNYVWGCELQSGGQRVLSSSWDKTVRVWDVQSGKLLSALDHESEVLCLHANSHRIVGASKEIRIWDYSATK